MRGRHPALTISPLPPVRIAQAVELVRRVFLEFAASGFSEEGVQEFFRYIDPEALRDRLRMGDLALWACDHGEALAGVAGFEPRGHVCLLFVDKRFQRRGIAKALLKTGLAAFPPNAFPSISVNASAYAVPAYARMGFAPTGPEQTVRGIRFIPMALTRHP